MGTKTYDQYMQYRQRHCIRCPTACSGGDVNNHLTKEKLMQNSIGDKASVFLVDVIARDNSGNVIGRNKVKQFSKDKQGCEACIKEVGYERLMSCYNRQAKTDERNTLARGGPSINKKVRDTWKGLSEEKQANFDRDLQALMERYKT